MTWVDTGSTPWYVSSCARNLAAATCTGVCWLAAMDRYMGMQKVEFKKTCTGFLDVLPCFVGVDISRRRDVLCATPR